MSSSSNSVLSAAWVALWLGCTAWAQGIPVRVAAGAKHGVLLKADGSVWTWGGNGSGQLGIDGDHAWPPVRRAGAERDSRRGGRRQLYHGG